jgi:mRNA deadenylase 3'-5' endonuclease subunit Ccr4
MRTSATPAYESRNKGRNYSNKNKDFMRRKWQAMREADHCRPGDFTFSLVTYNMLSDSLLYENINLYEGYDEEHLSWGYRKEKLLAELLSYEAEVSLCFAACVPITVVKA